MMQHNHSIMPQVAQTAQTAILIKSLSRLDEDAQEFIAYELARIKIGWLREALAGAIQQQQEEQAAEDAWIEIEAEKDANRYALEK